MGYGGGDASGTLPLLGDVKPGARGAGRVGAGRVGTNLTGASSARDVFFRECHVYKMFSVNFLVTISS